jgi:hypothetical protein
MHCRVEVKERADLVAKQAFKEGEDSQLLLPVAELKAQWKKRGKEELHSFCQRGESYFERYYRNGSSPCFGVIKMNRLAFMSVNRMRAGYTSLKANLI